MGKKTVINLKKILSSILSKKKAEQEADVPPTFREELNRQCNTLSLPVSILAIFSWPLFIPLDIVLHGNNIIVFCLRVGFSVVGLITLGLYFTSFFRKQGYWLVMFIIYYLGMATGWILGAVSADPIYMGGYAIVILSISLVPVLRIHGLLLLMVSLVIFKIVGAVYGIHFITAGDTYGLYNLSIAVAIALLAIFVFNKIRENSYDNRRLLQQANKELHKANELKNQLLQVAAHDLKDPLQVIIGYTDLLQMKLKDNKFAHERLKIIYRSTDRMIKLIAGLLEITSIESGNLVMHKNEVDFGPVVEASIKSFQKESEKKNQRLHSTLEKDCLVFGDGMLLRQVVNHLISNAIKFSPPGKSIWIALGKHDSEIHLKVKDEGPGLKENEIDRLFDKFQRLSSKPTAGEISTGLGLTITRDLVVLHDGKITVESQYGKGSTFKVSLPAYCKEAAINPNPETVPENVE